MKNIAVILAGGIGARLGGTTPKQLLPLADGRSILEHSVEAFEQAACIDEIGIVMHRDYLAQAQEMVRRNGWQKVSWVIAGGSERRESGVNAIREIERRHNKIWRQDYDTNCDTEIVLTDNDTNSGKDKIESTKESRPEINILLHDAARPFVSERIITDVCTALQHHEAVTVAIPATDTMYIIGEQEPTEPVVQDIPPRSTLMCAQTPQAFRLATIAEAYRLALQDTHLQATDDCGIVHRYLPHIPIHIVLGDAQNRKITYKEDL